MALPTHHMWTLDQAGCYSSLSDFKVHVFSLCLSQDFHSLVFGYYLVVGINISFPPLLVVFRHSNLLWGTNTLYIYLQN